METGKVSGISKPVINDNTNKDIKLQSLKEHFNDSGWGGIIRNWLVGLVVIVWGGQGIYDRNFNDKTSDTTEINKLIEENIKLQERIKNLEEKVVCPKTAKKE